jgi:hypothetical protein
MRTVITFPVQRSVTSAALTRGISVACYTLDAAETCRYVCVIYLNYFLMFLLRKVHFVML